MRGRLSTAGLVAGVVVAGLVTPAAQATTTSFGQTLVDKEQSGTEPAVRLDRSHGYEYVTAVGDGSNGGNVVWSSADGGRSWTKGADTGGGGGDSDIAFDADGRLYALDLLDSPGSLTTTIPYAVSEDHGATWSRHGKLAPNAGTGIAWDRQWIAARGSLGNGTDLVVATANSDSGVFAWVSTDAGKSWSGPHKVTDAADEAGPLTVAPDGTIWTAFWNYDAAGNLVISDARSTDGVNWTVEPVATQIDPTNVGYKGIHWPVVAIDSAGNRYITWARGQVLGVDNALNSTVFVATRPAQAATWTTPTAVSDPSHSAVFPWIVAGSTGAVDVAWYQAQQAGGLPDLGPELGGPQTTWDVVMAQSLNALTAPATYTHTIAAAGFHQGSICTGGLESCPGPQQLGVGNAPTPFDRRVLDFFTIDIDTAGNAVIAYPKDRTPTQGAVGDLVLSWSDLYIAHQTAGPTIAVAPTLASPGNGHRGHTGHGGR